MAKAITINRQHTDDELVRELKRTKDGRYRLRLQVILLVLKRYTSDQIHAQLLVSKHALFKWVRWYNQRGLEGIRDVSKGGRVEGNPLWDDSVFEALFAKLDQMEEYWSVPKMASWIQEEYKITIPERTIHHRLKVGGYSFKSSRPNPYKGDPNLQAAFKKTVL